MLVLFLAFAFAACLLAVPLLVAVLALRLAFGVLLLPFRLAGLALRLVGAMVIGLVAALVAGSLLLIPLLPVVALIGAIWMLLRLLRGRPASAHPASH